MIKYYKSLPVQAKASGWYTICNLMQNGISLIMVLFYIRVLPSSEFGRWSVFQSWRDILFIISSLYLYAGVYTKSIVDCKFNRDKYTSSMQGLGLICTLLVFLIYSLFHVYIDKSLEISFPYILFLFLYFAVYPGFLFWSAKQKVDYKYKSLTFVSVLLSFGILLFTLVFLRVKGFFAESLILGFLSAHCLIGLVFNIYHYYKGKCFFEKKQWLYALRFNVPLIPHYLSLVILNQADRIMIKAFCGESNAGIYSFAYQISIVITLLINAINGSRVPWTYEKLKSNDFDDLKKIIVTLVAFLSFLTICISLFSPEIIKIIGTGEYQMAVYVIPVVSLGLFYTFIYDLYSSVEFYYGSTRYVMYASSFGAILNLILNYIFIPLYGFVAAAYTTLVSYASFMILHYVFYRKVISEQNIRSVYNDKFIFILTFLTSIMISLILVSFNISIIRIVLIIFLIVFIALNYNKFLCIVKKYRNNWRS